MKQNFYEGINIFYNFRYGHPAGEFAGDTLNTVGNVYHISKNAKIVQPKHLAKKTVKEAGKALIYEYKNKNDGASTSNYVGPSQDYHSGDSTKLEKYEKK